MAKPAPKHPDGQPVRDIQSAILLGVATMLIPQFKQAYPSIKKPTPKDFERFLPQALEFLEKKLPKETISSMPPECSDEDAEKSRKAFLQALQRAWFEQEMRRTSEYAVLIFAAVHYDVDFRTTAFEPEAPIYAQWLEALLAVLEHYAGLRQLPGKIPKGLMGLTFIDLQEDWQRLLNDLSQTTPANVHATLMRCHDFDLLPYPNRR